MCTFIRFDGCLDPIPSIVSRLSMPSHYKSPTQYLSSRTMQKCDHIRRNLGKEMWAKWVLQLTSALRCCINCRIRESWTELRGEIFRWWPLSELLCLIWNVTVQMTPEEDHSKFCCCGAHSLFDKQFVWKMPKSPLNKCKKTVRNLEF